MNIERNSAAFPVAKEDFCATVIGNIAKGIVKEAMKFPEVMGEDHCARIGLILASYARDLGVKFRLENNEDKIFLPEDTGSELGVDSGRMATDDGLDGDVGVGGPLSSDSLAKTGERDLQSTSHLKRKTSFQRDFDDTTDLLDRFDAPKMLHDLTKASNPSYDECERVVAYFSLLLSKASRNIHPTIYELRNAKSYASALGTAW